MEQHIRLIILEHLGDQLDVHVLNVDLLYLVLNFRSATVIKPVYTPAGSCSSSLQLHLTSPVHAVSFDEPRDPEWTHNVGYDS